MTTTNTTVARRERQCEECGAVVGEMTLAAYEAAERRCGECGSDEAAP